MFPSLVLDDDIGKDIRSRVIYLTLSTSIISGLTLTFLAEAKSDGYQETMLGSALILFPLGVLALDQLSRRVAEWAIVCGYFFISFLAAGLLQTGAAASLLSVATAVSCLLLGAGHGLWIGLAVTGAIVLGGSAVDLGAGGKALVVSSVWMTYGVVFTVLNYASDMASWSLSNYERKSSELRDAQDQRLQLKQVQEDLTQANQEFARVSERLRAMAELADAARRAKEQFVSSVSHELRTPLNIIIGFSEMIAKAPRVYGSELPPKLLSDIEMILNASRHLSELVNDVLDLSRLDGEKMAISREWTSPMEIIKSAVNVVSPLFEARELRIELQIPANLPLLYCDRVRIRQVILNLLSNAGRYTAQGGAEVRVTVDGGEMLFAVSDTGVGIAFEDQPRIFEPFSKSSLGDGERQEGTGLGLVISKRFVEMHDGRMWFESQPGKGSTFYFALPIDQPASLDSSSIARWFSPYQVYEPRQRQSMAPKARLGPRFVVLEEGDTMRQYVNRYAESAEVVGLKEVDAAVIEANRLPTQVVIINKDASGREIDATAALASLPYGTVMAIYSMPGRREMANRLGLVDYLVKPVDGTALLGLLKEHTSPISTILIVDDELEALQLYGRILASAERRYRVIQAPTGQRAIALMRQHHPDMVLLDLVMEGFDGLAVLHEKSLDSSIRDIPVIALSAQDPVVAPHTSSFITFGCRGGIEPRELLRLIEAVSQILAPPDRLDRGRPGTPGD